MSFVRRALFIRFILPVTDSVTCGVIFLFAMAYIIYLKVNNVDSSKDPVAAANFLVSLVLLFMTAYQCIISALVLMDWMAGNCKSYIISMWYMSHVGILTVYWVMFIIEFSACVAAERYYIALFATAIALSYQGVFTYFVIVTYRYLKTV